METKSARERMVSLPEETVRDLICGIDQALDDLKYGQFGAAERSLEAVWRELTKALRTAEASDE